MTINRSSKKSNNIRSDNALFQKIEESILDYIKEKNPTNSNVGAGDCFCEWVLFNIFELREDEVWDATEISGKSDNGIDAIFEINSEICVLQSKYNNAHSIDALQRFIMDCTRLVKEPPNSDRYLVKENLKNVREKYDNGEMINCYYVTSNNLDQWEEEQLKSTLNDIKTNKEYNNLKFHIYDFDSILGNIEIKEGALPKEFRDRKITLALGKKFEADDTIVSMVSLSNFAQFVTEGGDTLFHSNIRNYLNNTKINSGIKDTLENAPENFWYYNNGITIVCEEFKEYGQQVVLTAPQIVNGCQTAKTLARFFQIKTNKEKHKFNTSGDLLVKIIRTRRRSDEKQKKRLRDEITRFTNSQNAVRGLDFYALEEFQRNLKDRFENLSYYYEIQRGAFITLETSKKKAYKGQLEYNYLLPKEYSIKKFVLPAKNYAVFYSSN